MPRSRSRPPTGRRDRRRRPVRVSDATVLLELLAQLDRPAIELDAYEYPDRDYDADFLLLDAFERAAWSFHAGPGPDYAGPGAPERALARLRAREWFLFEFELPSGLTAAEEWMAEREGEPGSAGKRRAVMRFLNSECGVFDVREARPDGAMLLVPLVGGEPVRARRIGSSEELVSGLDQALPSFEAGLTIAGRLYWRDDGAAELSAGACAVSAEARAQLLADPPPPAELLGGLALEAFLGADPSALLTRAADACFPNHLDALLFALSDGTFGYRRLCREVEGQPDPVQVARQLLWELDAWTDVEPELLAWAVAGGWLRRREAAAGRRLTADILARERRGLEDHVRSVLDTQAEPSWPAAAAGTALEIAGDETLTAIEELEVDEVEWIVDLRPRRVDIAPDGSLRPAPAPLACAIAEQRLDPLEGLEDGAFTGPRDTDQDDEDDESAGPDEEEVRYGAGDPDEREDEALFPGEDDDPFGDQDEEGPDEDEAVGPDEDGPLMLRDEVLEEGADEAKAALDTITETLLAEGRTHRPEQVVFRQRAIAARLGDTLRDAGLNVALRYFDEAVEVAELDGLPEEDPFVEYDLEDHLTTEAERLAFDRLKAAAERAQDGLGLLASPLGGRDPVAVTVTLERPLVFPFTTLEGVEERVGSVGVVVQGDPGDVLLRLFFAAPSDTRRFECRGPVGELLIASGDTVEIAVGPAPEDAFDRDIGAAALVPPEVPVPTVVVPVRLRHATSPAPLVGRGLEVAAGVMEAVAAAAERVAEDGPSQAGALDLRVEPLGDVKIEWRGRP